MNSVSSRTPFTPALSPGDGGEGGRRFRSLIASVLAIFVLLGVCANRSRAADDDVAAFAPPAGEAAKRTELLKAVLNVSALQPGKPATAALVFEVKPGFHSQSSTPTEDYLIAFKATPDDNAGLSFGKVVYPQGKRIPFPEPKELDVYEGKITIRIPIEVKKDAALGATKITGKLHYQVCDDKACFQPQDTPFTIETQIVPVDKPVEEINKDIFASAGPAAATVAADNYSLLGGLGLAFLVGITFNLVPCVLPVLPLKAMGFYEVSQHNRAKSISFGAVFSLGVIASFALLGLLVVVLKVFKWGELFAQPWFSAVLAIILVVMALNMFGLFTINLPTGVYAFSPRHDTYFGNFLFGILTAALSTPCTFGLFVSVLGWALTQPPAIGLLAISTVGAGMASPYLVLSAFPEMARRFPRTGPWAEVIRQSMGFLLLAVAAFFAAKWIGRAIGEHNVWWIIYACLAGMGVFVFAKAMHYKKTNTAPIVAGIIAALLIIPTFFLTFELSARPHNWTPYSSQALADGQAKGRVIIVEFTATWCANCKTIEAFVLNRRAVVTDVQKYQVLMLKADLTDDKAPGWALLRELKEQGIPLTAVYTPGTPQPARLNGFYKVDDLRTALAKAAEKAAPASTPAIASR